MTAEPLAHPGANPEAFLRALFDRAVAAADPMIGVPAALPPRKPDGRVLVIGAGKASARMAEAVEAHWGPCEGLVITRHGYGRPCKGIEIVEAAHPVPDAAGVAATRRLLRLLDSVEEGDFVLSLISGGGSALLCAPAKGITLAEKQALTEALLASGAPIGVMNGIRKEISAVKGGRLAAASWPATLLSLMISDVPGDAPGDIASGPTVGHAGSAADALDKLAEWNVVPPASIQAFLASGGDPVALDDPRLSRTTNVITAAPSQSLAAAAKAAEACCDIRVLGDALEGEARDLGTEQAQRAMAIQNGLAPGDRPVLLLSGGEVTVTRTGEGTGGPNAEAMLAAAVTLNGHPGIHALACDTDGVDGAAEVAGAVIGPDMPQRAAKAGRDMTAALTDNDAHGFFAQTGNQVVTGPTLTNVNDFRAFLILPPS